MTHGPPPHTLNLSDSPSALSDFPSEADHDAAGGGVPSTCDRIGTAATSPTPVTSLQPVAVDLGRTFESLDERAKALHARHDTLEREMATLESVLHVRLAELQDATHLASRTDEMLGRFERLSREITDQLRAAAKGRALMRRQLDRLDARQQRSSTLQELTTEVRRRALPRMPRARARLALLTVLALTSIVAIHSSGYGRSAARDSHMPLDIVLDAARPPADATSAEAMEGPPPEPVSIELPAPSAPAVRLPMSGSLSIRSSPAGADVFVDHERVGTTPLSLRRVRAGSRVVWIEHPEYRRWTAAVHVPTGQVARVNATLQPRR